MAWSDQTARTSLLVCSSLTFAMKCFIDWSRRGAFTKRLRSCMHQQFNHVITFSSTSTWYPCCYCCFKLEHRCFTNRTPYVYIYFHLDRTTECMILSQYSNRVPYWLSTALQFSTHTVDRLAVCFVYYRSSISACFVSIPADSFSMPCCAIILYLYIHIFLVLDFIWCSFHHSSSLASFQPIR